MNSMLNKAVMRQALNPQMLNRMRSIMGNMQSPEMQTVLNAVRGQNVSAEQLVRMKCRQMGIDADSFINEIRKF